MSENAYAPSATVLIKLAELFCAINTEFVIAQLSDNVRKLLDDKRVNEWYDRMAELQYVPTREVAKQGIEITVAASEPMLTEIRIPISGITPTGEHVSEELVLKPGDQEAVSKHSYQRFSSDNKPSATSVFDLKSSDTIKPLWALTPLTPEQINDVLCCTDQRGYQTFATLSKNHEAEDIASYTEATSVEEAMQKCLQEFAGPEYFNHGVKDIETQVVTMAAYKTVLDLE